MINDAIMPGSVTVYFDAIRTPSTPFLLPLMDLKKAGAP
jgi:hypothetical protein